jgi:hypothetical protein
MRQQLSESFIEKHKEKVKWEYISRSQILSLDFIKKHIEKININDLKLNKRIDHQTLKENHIL